MKPAAIFAEPPPHNPEAEAALLGSILLYPENMAKVATIVRPDDFYVTSNRIAYRAAFRLHMERLSFCRLG
jgi:replicative DNA helicase